MNFDQCLASIDAREFSCQDINVSATSESFDRQGVVRWVRDDAPEHRQHGVHNYNLRKDGSVEFYWGAYDLTADEAFAVAREKFKNLSRVGYNA